MEQPEIGSDVPLGSAPDRRELNELLGMFDAPAYIRRARGVEDAYNALIARLKQQRDEWLEMPRLRLATLRDLAGGWPALLGLLGEGQVLALQALGDEWQPRLRAPIEPTTSPRALRRAAEELIDSAERFNRRWQAYLEKVDLGPVNALREGYNRFYVIEKACALRSDVLARLHFQPLPPLGAGELLALFPLLPVPTLPEP